VSAQAITGWVFQRAAHEESIFTRFPRRVRCEHPRRFAIPQLGLAADETVAGTNDCEVVDVPTIDWAVESDDEGLS
jgi:hypothetical protein